MVTYRGITHTTHNNTRLASRNDYHLTGEERVATVKRYAVSLPHWSEIYSEIDNPRYGVFQSP